MNNNPQYDKSTNFLQLEVNVQRNIGILRDDISSKAYFALTINNRILP